MFKFQSNPAWADRRAVDRAAQALLKLAAIHAVPYPGAPCGTWLYADQNRLLIVPTLVVGGDLFTSVAEGMRREHSDALIVRIASTPLIARVDLSVVKQGGRGYEHWWHRYCPWTSEDGDDFRLLPDPEGRAGPAFSIGQNSLARRYEPIDRVDAALGIRAADIALSRLVAEIG